MMNLSRAFEKAGDFDILHTHIDLWEVFFSPLTKTVSLHTIHNPLYSSAKLDSRLYIFNQFKKNNYVCISESQKNLSRYKLNVVDTIYNGIRIKEFKFNPNPKDYFFWTARIDKYKGIENAIEIAEKTGIKLILAGRLDPGQKDYFRKNIEPHLNNKIKYIGEYNRSQKSKLFREAKALLYPIEWHEPFGLNMTESMASGTPVIAFKMGSVPEVVKHGKTGFVVKNITEAVKAVKKIDEIKRENCRKWVEENFTQKIMVDNCEKLYFRLLKNKK
jgi:glycosyltransferase involved in cell wall biosynthesis